MSMLRTLSLAAASIGFAAAAHATAFTVDAAANSSSGGTGAATISLTAGESFSVSVAATDLWNAGALPRWSNADGLTGNLFATGSDDSGQVAGTLIGAAFPLWSQGNLTAAYGTLVGQIGGGDYFAIGTNFSGVAATSGVLKLYYWDSNAGDNTEHITANITAVPEPDSLALMLAGLGVMGTLVRRRKLQG